MTDFAALLKAGLTSLEADLPDRLVAFNTGADRPQLVMPPILEEDERALSAVASGRAFYLGGRETHFTFPAIEAAVTEAEVDRFTQGQVAARLGAPVIVVVWVQDKDAGLPILYEQALGYSLCVREVLYQPGAFGEHIPLARVRVRYTAPDPELRRFDYLTVSALHWFWFDDYEGRPL